jgi:hypothetical protein
VVAEADRHPGDDFAVRAHRVAADRTEEPGVLERGVTVHTRPDRSPQLQIAIGMLAYCDMRTLYLRNVPDVVVERLERLAARDATSVGAVAVRELAEVSRRADHPALLGSLPDLDVDIATIVSDMDAERADR